MGEKSTIENVLFAKLDGSEYCPIGSVDSCTIECEQDDVVSADRTKPDLMCFMKQEAFEVTIDNPGVAFKNFFNQQEFRKEFAIVTKAPIPKRTHKKKRIAKKWRKRYGYKLIDVLLPCVKFEGNGSSEAIMKFKGVRRWRQ